MAEPIAQTRLHQAANTRRNSLPLHALWAVTLMAAAFTANNSVHADESDTRAVAETPGTSYSRSASAGWQAGTRRHGEASEKNPQSGSSVTIRAYEGFGALRPYYGDEPAYGIEVTAEIEECADGEERITSLNIGGRLYAVEGDCSDYRRRRQTSKIRENGKIDEEKAAETVIRCDQATWRCRIEDL